MNDVSRFSIYRNMSPDPQKRGEAIAINPFLIRIQDFVRIEDVSHEVPDPPDFRIKTMEKVIGVELTRSNPKLFGRGGFSKIGEFGTWEQEAKEKPLPRHEFEWGNYTLRDSLAAFQHEVVRKAKRARSYSARYDEIWLVFQAEKGSPHAGLIEGAHNPKPGREEAVLDFTGKHLYEMAKICKAASPFNNVLLFCGPKILAIPVAKTNFVLPNPDVGLLQRGAKAPDVF